mgnify:CR=1 FL=1
MCGISATPPSREIHKTALGATDSVKWEYYESTLDAVKTLKNKGYYIIGIEQADQGDFIQNFIPEANKKYALILGNEVHGIDAELRTMPRNSSKWDKTFAKCIGGSWHSPVGIL